METGGLVHYMTINTHYRYGDEDEDVIYVSFSVLVLVFVTISGEDPHLCSFFVLCVFINACVREDQINSTGLY